MKSLRPPVRNHYTRVEAEVKPCRSNGLAPSNSAGKTRNIGNENDRSRNLCYDLAQISGWNQFLSVAFLGGNATPTP